MTAEIRRPFVALAIMVAERRQFCATFLSPSATNHLTQKRGIRLRTWWKKEYLKDLYHRRVLAGGEPEVSRSAHPNWQYPAEVHAFAHRIGAPDLDPLRIQQALTTRSFFNDDDAFAYPTLSAIGSDEFTANEEDKELATNEPLVIRGEEMVVQLVRCFLRLHWPKAPEELILAASQRLHSNEALVELAKQLAVPDLVRTKEFPPYPKTIRDALLAVVGLLDSRPIYDFVLRFLMPRLNDLAMEDLLPYREPFPVLSAYTQSRLNASVEPRLLHSGGSESATPFHVVGIYANKRLIAKSPGECIWVALDLAAQEALLRLWGATSSARLFPFKQARFFTEADFLQAQQPNHSVTDICDPKSVDLSLYSEEELATDPLDVLEVARDYAYKVKPVVGVPHRKRKRHFFSRGTYARWSIRDIVTPRPHSI